MILGGLAQPDLAPSAALAFRDVCTECAGQLSGVADQLVPHCQVGTVKSPIEDTPKEDKPPTKGHKPKVLLYTHSIENHL